MVLGGNLFPSRAGTHCLTDDGLSLPRRRRRRRAQRTTPIWRGLPRVTLRVGSRRRPARGLRGHRTPPRSSLHAGGVSVRWRRWLHRTTRLALSQPACLASPAGEGRRRRAALVARAPPLELRATGKTTQQRRSGASACKLDLVERRRHFQSGAGGCQTCGSMAEAAAAPWVRRRWLRRRSIRRLLVREGWLRET